MIPYEHIDPEIKRLVEVLNKTGCITTIGSCIGHDGNSAAEVIFKVTDGAAWHGLMLRVLSVNRDVDYANIDIYQWHRLGLTGEYLVDWILCIEAHPRNRKTAGQEDRVLEIKKQAIGTLVAEMEKWQRADPATAGTD